jgi:hypothetical protein
MLLLSAIEHLNNYSLKFLAIYDDFNGFLATLGLQNNRPINYIKSVVGLL